MYPHLAYVFIDGGYLRALAVERSLGLLHPRVLGRGVVESGPVQTWAHDPTTHPNALLGRITYYDALPDHEGDGSNDSETYWNAIEVLDDVHLGFGALRGLKRKVRQKGVDTLIAVDMLVGAFSGLFDIAVLVAGDADFVPVVEEVKRSGVMVAVAASATSLSKHLRRVADRFIDLPQGSQLLQVMIVDGRTLNPGAEAPAA